MFGSFFARRPLADASLFPPPPPVPGAEVPTYAEAGLRYPSPAGTAGAWLAMPYAHPDAADRGARLAQLVAEGRATLLPGEVLLPWNDVYAVLEGPGLRRVPRRLVDSRRSLTRARGWRPAAR